MSHLIAPSVLAADFGNLQRDVEMLNNSDADWIHVDVMDGVYVPNISFGFPVLKAIKKVAQKPLDVHLMIQNPDKYLEQFRDAGAYMLTVHFEGALHFHRTIQTIKELGMKAGVAINPQTPPSALIEIITDVDMVLLMSVNPGYGGQKFIPNSLNKLARLKALIQARQSKALIEIDGGIGPSNAEEVLRAGADVLVAGSSVFKSENPMQAISDLKSARADTITV